LALVVIILVEPVLKFLNQRAKLEILAIDWVQRSPHLMRNSGIDKRQ